LARQSLFDRSWIRVAVPVLTCALIFGLRTRGISGHFWMLGDQIRDWAIALRPLTSLPLVGPPTHVHGYTIGPAFYWILWCIRVVFGPWFDNLPHGGGIGQALLQSGVDSLLLVAVWKRTRSVWLGLAAVLILATAPFDLALAPIVWNPVVGSVLAKAAVALVVLDWPRASLLRIGMTAAIAWSAVHAYTGTIFVALGVFAALTIDVCIRRDWPALLRRAAVIAAVVAALQVPYAIHQMSTGFGDSGMAAVSSSLVHTLTGNEPVRLARSATEYINGLQSIHEVGGSAAMWGWILIGCAAIAAFGYRREPALLTVVLMPQALTVIGYAFWFADLGPYYYLSLMPPIVLTVVLAITSVIPQRATKALTVIGVVSFAGALALVPSRLSAASTMFRMPEYRALVAGSREIAKRKQPMRSIGLEFRLPPTSDPTFIYRILGGDIDRAAAWRAIILADGRVEFVQVPAARSTAASRPTDDARGR
jgi:hypothetical protein